MIRYTTAVYGNDRRLSPLWLVAWVAFAFQIAYMGEARRDPTFGRPILDGREYEELALKIAAGNTSADTPYSHPPLYPGLVAVAFRFFGPSFVALKLMQALIGTLTCVLTARLAQRLFTEREGVIAGLITAACGPLVFLNLQMLPAGLAVLLTTASLLLGLHALRAPTPWNGLACGVSTGLAALTDPHALALLPVFGIGFWLAGVRRRSWKPESAGFALLIVGTALAIAPATVRNYRACGEPVLISTGVGIQLYIGNNEHTDQTLLVRPGLDWEYLEKTPFREGASSPDQADRYFVRRVLDWARNHPLRFIAGLFDKTRQLISARELPRTLNIYDHREYSRLLSVLVWRIGPFAFPFGALAPLAFLGLLVAWHPHAAARLLAAYLAACGCSIILFYVAARYRLLLVPALAVFAAHGIAWIAQRARRPSQRVQGLAVVCLSAALVNWPLHHPTDGFNFKAEMHTLLGLRAQEQGEGGQAEAEYVAALREDPSFAKAYNALGLLRLAQQRLDEAAAAFSQAIESDPGFAEARSNLGLILLMEGRTDEAAAQLEAAIALRPFLAKPHEMLGMIRLRGGDTAAALRSFRASIAAEPNRFEPCAQMAWVLATHPDPAIRDGHESLRFARTMENLARPADIPRAADILAATHAECGRFDDALRVARRAAGLFAQQGDAARVEAIRQRMLLYSRREPFRDTSLAPAPLE